MLSRKLVRRRWERVALLLIFAFKILKIVGS